VPRVPRKYFALAGDEFFNPLQLHQRERSLQRAVSQFRIDPAE
jgi:hypothetical protein